MKPEPIQPVIQFIRDQRVILDSDLAGIYAVTTKRLNEQVKRNCERFPEDFMFRLTAGEASELRSLSTQGANSGQSQFAGSDLHLKSQIATSR